MLSGKWKFTHVMVCIMIVATGIAFAQGGGESAVKESPRKLVVWQFRGCNLENQINEWGTANGVEIELIIADRNDMMNNLTTVLAAGKGVPDVVTVGGPFIERFKKNEIHWTNFLDLGAASLKSNYVDWRWNQMLNANGTFMMGLPTDIGPIAMGYRIDLFEKAGLPTDCDEVSRLIQTWEDFIEVGKIIREKTGAGMVNNLTTVFECMLGQDQANFFDENGNLVLESNARVKEAWDTIIAAYNAKISNNIDGWTAEWGAGLQNGDFAVQMMPSWMMGTVKTNAPDAIGLWDIALLPEEGGNWGGSMIAIPAKSTNQKLGYELVSWVLSPEQQFRTFKVGGQFPSTPPVYTQKEFLEFTDPYFNDAPIGKVYSEAAMKIKGAYLGPNYQTVIDGLVAAIGRVEDGLETPEKSFANAVADIKRQLAR